MAPSRETVIDANLSTSPRRSDRVTPIRWSSLRDPTHRVNCPSDHAILTARLLTRRTESTGARPSFATPRTNCTSSSLEASRGDSVPPQEPLHCRDGQALVPVDVRMVLVQAVVERRSLVLGGPMLRPAWLRQRRQQSPAAFLPRKLERWRAWEQIARQRLHDQADICLIEITQPAQCFSSSLRAGARLLMSACSASRSTGRVVWGRDPGPSLCAGFAALRGFCFAMPLFSHAGTPLYSWMMPPSTSSSTPTT